MKFDKRIKKVYLRQFLIFFLLVGVSTIVIQHGSSALLTGCSSSPYNDFKAEYCGDYGFELGGQVHIYGREPVSLPTALLEVAAVNALPIFTDHLVEVIHPFTGLSFIFPISGHIQFNTYVTPENKLVPFFNFAAYVIHTLYVAAMTAVLAKLWNQKKKAGKVGVVLILLFIYKWIALITIPLAFLLA